MTISRRKPPALLTNISSVTAIVVLKSVFFATKSTILRIAYAHMPKAYALTLHYTTSAAAMKALRVN